MTDDLIAFVSARLDEDEATARHEPERLPREVAAKRAILTMDTDLWRIYRTYEAAGEPGTMSLGRAQAADRAVRYLAAVWNDHPDYREAWRPLL